MEAKTDEIRCYTPCVCGSWKTISSHLISKMIKVVYNRKLEVVKSCKLMLELSVDHLYFQFCCN